MSRDVLKDFDFVLENEAEEKPKPKAKAKAKPATKKVDPATIPFRQRIRMKDINPVVEEVFSSVYQEWHGSPYVFSLNNETFVVFFDDVTPTRLPKEVMEYFKKDKLPRINQIRTPNGKEPKETYTTW